MKVPDIKFPALPKQKPVKTYALTLTERGKGKYFLKRKLGTP